MSDLADLSARYGAPGPLRRPLVLTLVVLLAAAGLGWLVWAGFLHGGPSVSSQLMSYDVQGEHRAVATFGVVRRQRSDVAHCLLRATAVDHSVVGELNVVVGPRRPASATLHRAVRTERRATSVELVGCTAPGQKRPG